MEHKKIIFASLFTLLLSVCILSCSEEEVYRAKVLVTMIDTVNSDIRTPIPNCKLIFGEDHFSKDIKRTVYTNDMGIYEGEWHREAFLKIQASKEINGKMYTGGSSVKVKKEGIGNVEILIKEE